ncbi:hypothetical protein MYU51_010205 [Penicillium brevicompactum]
MSKRSKNSHHDDLRAPPRTQYTIAWVCALYIEMAAAQAMLDELHERLPASVDNNNYILGSINQHNVVIACLPEGQYGTNNAAIVMTNMKRTFPEIRACLMVGIGGGVPRKADIRLGDVVVGTRVMQCDLGKLIGDGQLQRTAISRLCHPLFGTTISTVRSKHEHRPSQVPSILQQKLGGRHSYSRPTSADLLFYASYEHESLADSCDGCDHSKLVPRSRRAPHEVMIHYGAIASGNQVMRNSTTRDTVARELDVMCFEMESAGLMDILPCLPIRGICDYADSHKNKEWQRYAAATAAAYARELLEELHVTESHPSISTTSESINERKLRERRERLLESFKFDQIDFRKTIIKEEEETTCRWFLSHPDYEAWLDPARLTQHHGFLWISGKPGAGKSTIMKFAYKRITDDTRYRFTVTASFFFNARGTDLEKSTFGMYRSLLLQLLEAFPDLQVVLDNSDLVPKTQNDCFPLIVLKNVFEKAVCTLGKRSFICFIDALDECDEQQAVEMVQYFEALTKRSTEKDISFRVCFSSRHYPYISIQRGIRHTLEHQSGHTADLATYVTNRLHITEPKLVTDLRQKILSKAAGVFMWVVLVVKILNKEYGRGGLALRKRLAELPSDLSELFKEILRRDEDDMEAFQLCILWILYAKKPLRPQELYHALWIGLSPTDLVDSHIPDATVSGAGVSPDTCRITRSVIGYSKGLAETTMSRDPIVQFIHESVRDFLIKDKGLYELWPELGLDCEGLSHERLKQCCNLYMNHDLICESVTNLLSESDAHRHQSALRGISKDYPFLWYANQHILFHANAAAKVVPQDAFLSSFAVLSWIDRNNVFPQLNTGQYSRNANFSYILADRGCPELIRARPKEHPHTQVRGERYDYSIFAAIARGSNDTVGAILDLSSSFQDDISLEDYFRYSAQFSNYEGRTPLTWAAQEGQEGIVRLLLQRGVGIDGADRRGLVPLSRALSTRQETVARSLIESGADIHARDRDGRTPLYYSVANDNDTITRLLVVSGADINAGDLNGQTPLYRSVTNGNETAARFLIDSGADVNIADETGWTPLYRSVMKGNEAIAKLLVENGALIDSEDLNGRTPLYRSVTDGNETMTRLLVDSGANINAGNLNGRTPLYQSVINDNEKITRFLLAMGAKIDICDKFGWTPLHQSTAEGHEAKVKLLIECGAKTNTSDDAGQSPLNWAAMSGHEVIARLLIEARADIETYDKYGWTPLQWSSAHGHEAVARLLITMGADVNTRDLRGQTPLDQALRNGHEGVARFLTGKNARSGLDPINQ